VQSGAIVVGDWGIRGCFNEDEFRDLNRPWCLAMMVCPKNITIVGGHMIRNFLDGRLSEQLRRVGLMQPGFGGGYRW